MIPEGWTKPALDTLARDWTSIITPEGKDLWIQLKTGKSQYSSPFLSEITDAKNADARLTSYAYWGDVNEVGNDHVRQEVFDFVCPAQQPEQLRDSLTKTVPKARIIPNKVVMQTTGDQYERWKQLMPSSRLRGRNLRLRPKPAISLRSRRLLCNC